MAEKDSMHYIKEWAKGIQHRLAEFERAEEIARFEAWKKGGNGQIST